MNLTLDMNGSTHTLSLDINSNDGSYIATLDDRVIAVEASLVSPGILSIIIDGKAFRCVLEESPLESAVHVGGQRFAYAIADPRSLKARRGRAGGATGPVAIKAPMPGRIVRLLVAVGDAVEAHQGILVIEAMKMQNELKSSKAGRITDIRYRPGDAVAVGEVLAVIE
jgi:biotin carboxyl carrier protein